MMEDPFDSLARRVTGRISRRQALRLVLGASAASLIAARPAVRAAAPVACPQERQCSGDCCPENTECCNAGGQQMCCPNAGLVVFPCPATIERALLLGCMRLTP